MALIARGAYAWGDNPKGLMKQYKERKGSP